MQKLLMWLIFLTILLAGCPRQGGPFDKCSAPDDCTLLCPAGTELVGNEKQRYCVYPGDVKHGPYAAWYSSGNLASRVTYRDGKVHGVWTDWYDDESGQKLMQVEYVDGIIHGQFTDWWENGQLRTQGQARHDRPCGDWKCWTREGEPRTCEKDLEKKGCSLTGEGAVCPSCGDP